MKTGIQRKETKRWRQKGKSFLIKAAFKKNACKGYIFHKSTASGQRAQKTQKEKQKKKSEC